MWYVYYQFSLCGSLVGVCLSFSQWICHLFVGSFIIVFVVLLYISSSVVSCAFKSVLVTSGMNWVSCWALLVSSEVEEDRRCHFKLVDMRSVIWAACVIKAVSAGIWQTLRRWAFVCLSYGFCALSSHMLQHLKTHRTWTKHWDDSVEPDNQEKYTLGFLKC